MTNPNSINPDLREWDIDRVLDEIAEPVSQEYINPIFDVSAEQQFRYPCCGLACALVEKILHSEGITQTQQMRTEIVHSLNRLPRDDVHVILRVTTDEGDFYIDPSFSQFFRDIGLDLDMITEAYNPFPDERGIVFKADEVDDVVTWLTDVVRSFWQNHNHSAEYLKRHRFSPQSYSDQRYFDNFRPPVHITDSELREYFGHIYDLSKYEPMQPSRELQEEVDILYSKLTVDTSGAYL
jgi:5-methylthioribose kinase